MPKLHTKWLLRSMQRINPIDEPLSGHQPNRLQYIEVARHGHSFQWISWIINRYKGWLGGTTEPPSICCSHTMLPSFSVPAIAFSTYRSQVQRHIVSREANRTQLARSSVERPPAAKRSWFFWGQVTPNEFSQFGPPRA